MCALCGCEFARLRELPSDVRVVLCESCHEEVVTRAMNVPITIEKEVSAAVDALAAGGTR